ncbi:uncharacterized protein LOC131851325 [Achroia grisella]|uniref:uncharacterized protein LOC131851325 n=1 Tax=Achroia grisella TaxID=688607 RepID=UPI0027D2CC91|nr:uncharacterized protein LOC131851325 [Achroia grisella]
MQAIETLEAIEERKLARRFFSSAVSKLEESITKKNKEASETNFANLTARYEKLSAVNNKVLDLWRDLVGRNESKYEKDVKSIEKYDDIWFSMQQKYKNAFVITKSCKSNIGTEIQESYVQDTVVKNILRLPRYDGDMKKWIGFWGMFQKIHVDSSIDENMKFQYLLQSMEPGSPAAILVESFSLSSAHYQKAVKQLKERYGRDDLLIEIYIRELLTLVQDQLRGTATQIGVLYDKLKTQLHALDSLNVTTDKYASMLRPLVESALPIELIRIWKRTESCKTDQSNYFKNLLKFIKQKVESEERIKISDLDYSQSSSSKFTASGPNDVVRVPRFTMEKKVLPKQRFPLEVNKEHHVNSSEINKPKRQKLDNTKQHNYLEVKLPAVSLNNNDIVVIDLIDEEVDNVKGFKSDNNVLINNNLYENLSEEPSNYLNDTSNYSKDKISDKNVDSQLVANNLVPLKVVHQKINNNKTTNLVSSDNEGAYTSETSDAQDNAILVTRKELECDIISRIKNIDRIKQIEEEIRILKTNIKKLEVLEVDDDSMSSSYIQVNQMKAAIVKLYKELCSLTGDEEVKRRKIRLQVMKDRPQLPVKKLEQLINDNIGSDGNPQLPGFNEVIQCVDEANRAENLGWTKAQINNEAWALYMRCSRALKEYRQKREYRDLISCVQFNLEADPADTDPHLLARLEENKRQAMKKEAERLGQV